MTDLTSTPTLVIGASRGLGRGIAYAFAQAGAPVVAAARSASALAELAESNPNIQVEVCDATDAASAIRLLDAHQPRIVILVAGATPPSQPLDQQTWDAFSVNWHTDVQLTFHWLQAALLKPLPPSSQVVVISSAAALMGSPLSGGYAGAKATQRFITNYAQDEATRLGLGITFTSVLPRLTPHTELGHGAVLVYAARHGLTEQQYLDTLGTPLTPESTGAWLVDLVTTAPQGDGNTARAYLLTGDGLQLLP